MTLRTLLCVLIAVVFLVGCKGPSGPDFQLEHALQIPIINNKTVQFLGGANALLDTTQTDFESLFKVNPDGMVHIVFDTDFNVGDFDDALPELIIDPHAFSTSVGSLQADFNGSGSTSYQEVVGGTPKFSTMGGGGSSSDIIVQIAVNNFETGIIEEGGIRVDFANDLGFDIATLDAQLISSGSPVGTPVNLTNIGQGESQFGIIEFEDGDVIQAGTEGLQVRIDLTWDELGLSTDGELLIHVSDEELLAREVTSVLAGQHFSSDDSFEIETTAIRFLNTGHYASISSGQLAIQNVINSIDLDIESLEISIPGILKPTGEPLVVTFKDENRIRRSSDALPPAGHIISLENHRIVAPGNSLEYTITGITEDTGQSNDSLRTVQANQEVHAEIQIDNLVINQAVGVIERKMVNLNPSDAIDDSMDLFNDSQVEITQFDDFEYFSQRLKDVSFYDTEFIFEYNTNLGVESTIYGAILGISEAGKEVYLSGKPGTDAEVTASDDVDGLKANGLSLSPSKLIKFQTQASSDINNPDSRGMVIFSKENSNIEEFISNMPTEVRFIGKSLINPDNKEGFVADPVLFNASIGMDIPMNIATSSPAEFSDTLQIDLSSLPGIQDDTYISEALLSINYENSLPLLADLSLTFLNEHNQVITQYPFDVANDPTIQLLSATVDSETRFVTNAKAGLIEINMLEGQMAHLNQTRQINMIISFQTASSSEVRIRAEDYINLMIFGKFKTKTRINN